ncbi:MAG: HAD family phosphatase [Opitutales bacterium]|nr:HAD family phosphatase [Opitutales bacterium]
MAFEHLKIDFPTKLYEGYIFDCDGTLADSMTLHHKAWQHAFRSHGASFEYTWDIFFSLAGVGHADTVRRMNMRFGDTLDPEAVTRTKEEWYEQNVDKVGPISPVVDFARQLRARGAKMAVASGGPRVLVLRTLKSIGMEDMFEAVVTQDDITRSKPDPEIFLTAAYRIGADPHKCVVFEDSYLGIDGAKAAGMDWVQIPPTGGAE